MDKLYFLDPEDIPCSLDRLVTTCPLLPEQREKLAALECGDMLELMWPEAPYSNTIVCCGTERHVVALAVLCEAGATKHLSDAESLALVRNLIKSIDKAS